MSTRYLYSGVEIFYFGCPISRSYKLYTQGPTQHKGNRAASLAVGNRVKEERNTKYTEGGRKEGTSQHLEE
jgi:hypothetical protein